MADHHDTPRRARWEVTAGVLTVAAFVASGSARIPLGVFIAAASAGWASYVVTRVRADRGVLGAWGLRRGGLGPVLAVVGTIGALAAAAMAIVAADRHALLFDGHLALALVLYPLWGLVQQFVLQAMVARHLLRWTRSPWVVSPAVALLFALVHAPNLPLMAATFAMALCFTPVYCRWRNLLPLGLFHGWLGALFYSWVLGRDPLLEVL